MHRYLRNAATYPGPLIIIYGEGGERVAFGFEDRAIVQV